VIRANNRDEFVAAAKRIRKLLESPELRSSRESNLGRILVEGYIPGREVAVEGVVSDGALRVLAIFDKPDPLEGPYFEETIYVTPSRLAPVQQRSVERCAQETARAVGLTQGPVHAEFRIGADRSESGQVWPLEIAARPIGGLCARALRFVATGEKVPRILDDPSGAAAIESIGLEDLLLRHALHQPVDQWEREQIASSVMMIPVPSSGVLEQIEGQEAARATPGISELVITARLHDYIEAWPEGSSYLGFLFAKSGKPEDAEEALRIAHAKLKFNLAQRLPVQHPLQPAEPA
jgi:hypothetical protein